MCARLLLKTPHRSLSYMLRHEFARRCIDAHGASERPLGRSRGGRTPTSRRPGARPHTGRAPGLAETKHLTEKCYAACAYTFRTPSAIERSIRIRVTWAAFQNGPENLLACKSPPFLM